MARGFRRAVPAVALLFGLALSARAQDKTPAPSPLGGQHTSRDPRRCKRCAPALSKALSYVAGKAGSAGYTQKLMLGWLGLVDPSCSEYTGRAIQLATSARSVGFNGNWYIALGGIFLAAVYYRYRDGRAAGGMQSIMVEAQKNQHYTGGWHHNKNFKKQGYSEDLGILTAMLFGMFMTMKGHGMSVPRPMLEKAEKNLESLMGPTGIGYGTGKGKFDTAGSRGAYAFMGLHFGGASNHPFYEKLKSGMRSRIASMNKGHAVGCLHFLSMSIGAYLAGFYDEVAKEWIDQCIDRQGADGSILLGDDGVGGGEGKTLGDKVGSTAVFAIMLLLQKPGAFDPPSRPQARKKPRKKPGRSGGSPFGRPRPREPAREKTRGGPD